MRGHSQSQSFVKQVQVDLLALCDTDLLSTVRQWIEGDGLSEGELDVPEETRFALGYVCMFSDARWLAHPHADGATRERERLAQWHAPSPHHLRTLLTTMDGRAFAQHIIPFAYQSLHPTHPEWSTGVTFNAHLANYLRQMRDETTNPGQKALRKDRNSRYSTG